MLIIAQAPVTVIIKVKSHQHRWLAGNYDLEIEHFRGGLHGGYLVDSGFFAQLGSASQVQSLQT